MAYNSKYTGQQVEDILDSVGNKQDSIADLDTIRQGASLGETSVQEEGGYATTSGIRHREDSLLYTFKGSSNESDGDCIIPTMREIFENDYIVANGIYDRHNGFKYSLKHSEYEGDGDYIIATIDYVDDAIANAITNTLNTPV